MKAVLFVAAASLVAGQGDTTSYGVQFLPGEGPPTVTDWVNAFVYLNPASTKRVQVVSNPDSRNSAVVGSFEDNTTSVGWSFLKLTGNPEALDEEIAYASGFLEAQLSAVRMYQSFVNLGANWTWDAPLEIYINNNSIFMADMIQEKVGDIYWHNVWLQLLQLHGLYDGYQAAVALACDSNTDSATPALVNGGLAHGCTELLGGMIGAIPNFPIRAFMGQQISAGDMEDLGPALGVQEALSAVLGVSADRFTSDLISSVFANPLTASKFHTMYKQVSRRMVTVGQERRQGRWAPKQFHGFGGMWDDVAMEYEDDALVGEPTFGPDGLNGDKCSGMAKLAPDFSEFWISQTTWSGFECMVRVLKYYDLPYRMNPTDPRSSVVPGRVTLFSSTPGLLYSADDYYQMYPSQMVSLETTIGNNNMTLYALYIKPTTVLDWIRNPLANRLANSGEAWYRAFNLYNSGTYNNEFLIGDYKLFRKGQQPLPGLLYVVDQAPGFMTGVDWTASLVSEGYFGSYNIPSDPFIFNITGNAPLVAEYGPWFSWSETARAQIFRRNQSMVVDDASFGALMRYNNFQHDPISTQSCAGNPPYSAENAVAARDDLNPANGVYPIGALGHRDHAAIDVKFTSAARMARGVAGGVTNMRTQAGPTYDQQPPFAWSTTTPDIANLTHLGEPDLWQFPWQDIMFQLPEDL